MPAVLSSSVRCHTQTQTLQRQLCCWKGSAHGEDYADVNFHAQLLCRYSQYTLFQKQYWKSTAKRKQFCGIPIANFFIRLFIDIYQSYVPTTIVSQLLYKARTKITFLDSDFCLIMTALMLIILSAFWARGQLIIRYHLLSPIPSVRSDSTLENTSIFCCEHLWIFTTQ